MKKVVLTLAAVALMASPAMAAAPSADANTGPNTQQYHSYDGLICTDCHTLHGSEDGAAVAGSRVGSAWDANGTYRELLFKGDWTDMCLSCHTQGYNTAATADLPSVSQEYGNWTAPIVMTTGTDTANSLGIAMPAGDFRYSKENPAKGHNPAYTKGSDFTGAGTSLLMTADPLKAAPPGGGVLGIEDGEWSCHSCHGMHSRFSSTYSAYRQLKRTVNKKVVTGEETATLGVESTGGASGPTAAGYEPILSNSRGDIKNGTDYKAERQAAGSKLDGADLFAVESDSNKNVYRGGFSSFCSACHGDFHGGSDLTGTAQTKAGQSTDVRDGAWVKHPTNLVLGNAGASEKGSATTIKAKYGVNNTTATKGGYNVVVTSSVGTANPNPVGYDWKYPLVVDNDNTGNVEVAVASAGLPGTLTGNERIMCLTCHKAHASEYENMTRWDTNKHAFIGNGEIDFTGEASTGDNPAYGCGKCHQKGGAKAYVKRF